MTLSLEAISLTVGDGDQQVTALDHVDLDVAAGEMVAILGPSGSGKSSLLAVAGALLQPDEGIVRLDGEDLAGLGQRDRARLRRQKIGFVFQASNLVPSLTALEQLELIWHLDGQRPRAHRDEARALLEEVGMGHRLDRRPDQLSGGERQRVGIARALAASPSLLLTDEPTSALDRARSAEIVELLAHETHARGVATVMVTHDTGLLGVVDRVYEMEDGRLREAQPVSR